MYARAMQAKTQKLYKVIRFSSEIRKNGQGHQKMLPARLPLRCSDTGRTAIYMISLHSRMVRQVLRQPFSG